MPLTPISMSIWILAIAGQMALAFLLIVTGTWRKWPSLLAFLSILSARDLFRIGLLLFLPDTDSRAALDYYGYWSLSFLAQLAELWILAEVACEMIGVTRWVRRCLRLGTVAAATFSLSICVFMSFGLIQPRYSQLVTMIHYGDKVVSLAWLLTFLYIVIGADILGMEWPASARGVALGFALESSGSMIESWLYDRFPHSSLLSDAKGLIFLAAVLVWAAFLGRKVQTPEAAPTRHEVAAFLNLYLGSVQKIRGPLK